MHISEFIRLIHKYRAWRVGQLIEKNGAVEASCVMRFTNRQSSSSTMRHITTVLSVCLLLHLVRPSSQKRSHLEQLSLLAWPL